MKGTPIPKRHLNSAWKKLSRKPLPKVKAIKLRDEDFNNVLQHRHCLEDDFREIEEWGRILSTKGTDACVFNGDETDDSDYIILVGENPYNSWMKSSFMSYRILPEATSKLHLLRNDFRKQSQPVNAWHVSEE